MEKGNRINAYVCYNLHSTITVQLDDGSIPAILKCQTEGCNMPSRSMLGMVNQKFPPTHEWFKPSDIVVETLSPPDRNHVMNGGLMLRPILSNPGEEKHTATEAELFGVVVTDMLGIPEDYIKFPLQLVQTDCLTKFLEWVYSNHQEQMGFIESTPEVTTAYLEYVGIDAVDADKRIDERIKSWIEKKKK